MNKSRCSKCGFESDENLSRLGMPLCSICIRFAPNEAEKLDQYIEEKINSKLLDTFRKFSELGNLQKKGMIKNNVKSNKKPIKGKIAQDLSFLE